jgi:hypothetical protein
MNQPYRPQTDSDPDGATVAKALAREYAWDRLEDVRRLSEIVQSFLELGDDRGAGYAIAKLLVHLGHAVETLKGIKPDGRTT